MHRGSPAPIKICTLSYIAARDCRISHIISTFCTPYLLHAEKCNATAKSVSLVTHRSALQGLGASWAFMSENADALNGNPLVNVNERASCGGIEAVMLCCNGQGALVDTSVRCNDMLHERGERNRWPMLDYVNRVPRSHT